MGLINTKPKYTLEILHDENFNNDFCGYDFCIKHILGDKINHFIFKNEINNKWIYFHGPYHEIYNLWILDSYSLEKKGIIFFVDISITLVFAKFILLQVFISKRLLFLFEESVSSICL
mgnify:CR=1 FL=1